MGPLRVPSLPDMLVGPSCGCLWFLICWWALAGAFGLSWTPVCRGVNVGDGRLWAFLDAFFAEGSKKCRAERAILLLHQDAGDHKGPLHILSTALAPTVRAYGSGGLPLVFTASVEPDRWPHS